MLRGGGRGRRCTTGRGAGPGEGRWCLRMSRSLPIVCLCSASSPTSTRSERRQRVRGGGGSSECRRVSRRPRGVSARLPAGFLPLARLRDAAALGGGGASARVSCAFCPVLLRSGWLREGGSTVGADCSRALSSLDAFCRARTMSRKPSSCLIELVPVRLGRARRRAAAGPTLSSILCSLGWPSHTLLSPLLLYLLPLSPLAQARSRSKTLALWCVRLASTHPRRNSKEQAAGKRTLARCRRSLSSWTSRSRPSRTSSPR